MATDTREALKAALTVMEDELRQRQERPNSLRIPLIALSSDEIDAVVEVVRERLGIGQDGGGEP